VRLRSCRTRRWPSIVGTGGADPHGLTALPSPHRHRCWLGSVEQPGHGLSEGCRPEPVAQREPLHAHQDPPLFAGPLGGGPPIPQRRNRCRPPADWPAAACAASSTVGPLPSSSCRACSASADDSPLMAPLYGLFALGVGRAGHVGEAGVGEVKGQGPQDQEYPDSAPTRTSTVSERAYGLRRALPP
jgi:hypothetical protein